MIVLDPAALVPGDRVPPPAPLAGVTGERVAVTTGSRISANRQSPGGPERCRREAAALQGWGAA